MSLVCGWVGFAERPDRMREILASMAVTPPGSAPEDGTFWIGESCALAVAPGATPVSIHRDDDLWVVVVGVPRFTSDELQARAAGSGAAAAVAAGYRRDGRAVLERLRDGFSVAIVHPETGDLVLAIDRVGGRHPLSFKSAGGALVFGSDGDAIQRHPAGRSEVDPQAIYHYLYFQVVPGPWTARRGVRRLMPGEALVAGAGSSRVERYWEMVYLEHERGSVAELERELLRVLRESVGRDAEGEVGCFLSGGTDSSTVVGMLGERTGKPARAYAIGFGAEGYDEMEFARCAAEHFGAELHDYYVKPADVVELIPRVAAAYSDPFGNASTVPAYYCARMAREQGVRVLLGGDGGDELFGGNERYRTQHVFGLYERVPAVLRRALIEPVAFGFPGGASILPVRKLRSYIEQARVPMPRRLQSYNYLERMEIAAIFEPEFLRSVDSGRPAKLMDEIWEAARAESLLNRMLALDLRVTLADNDLPKVSRMCELADVEVRYPLLSDAMLDFSRRVPPRYNLKGGKLRWFWKHALRDFLPRNVLTKSKHGFGLPFGVWMRDDPGLNEMTRASLDRLKGRGIVLPGFIDRMLELHGAEHAAYYGVMIWLLVILEHWFAAHPDS